jgi:hypothetical protein
MKIDRSKKIDWNRINFEDDMTPEEEKEYYIKDFLILQEEYIQIKKDQEDIQRLPKWVLKDLKINKNDLLIEELELKYTQKLEYLLQNYWETIINRL